MKSLTGKFASSRGWAVLFILFLGAGLFVAACGDEEVPTPTTPAPPPPPPPTPEPEPEPEPPATPTGLMISETTETSITWIWNAVEGATAYAVQISMDETFGDDDVTALALTATYTVSDLPPSTSIYLRVAAGVGTSLEDALLSDWSTHVTGMTAMPPPPPEPPEPPAVPTGLQVSSSGDDFIEWSWDAVEGADGYEVQFSPDEMFDSGDEIIPRAADQTSYRREPLPVGSSAFLRVRSRAGTGEDRLESEWSIHVTGMTTAPPPPPPPEPPAVPTGLQVSSSGEDFIEWTWDEVEGADGYEVQFSPDEMFDSGDEIIPRAADQTSYRREPLPVGSSAFLRVRSRAGTGEDRLESEWSTHVTGMTTAPPPPPPEPPAVPTGLQVSSSGEDFIEWTWDEVEGADGYEVQFSTNEMFDDAEIIGRTADQTSYRRQPLPAGSTAYLRVRSHAGAGEDRLESAWSAHATGMTDQPMAPATPANLQVTARGEGYIEWSWDEVEGADGYDVQYSLDDERFTDQDPTAELAATETSYRVDNLAADMDVYLRVRSFAGSGADRLESAWSTHATGMTVPPAPMAPASPTGITVSGSGDDYIEWRWNAVSGADGYEVQFSDDEQFTSADRQHDVGAELTYRQSGLDFGTFGYLRVRAYVGSGTERLSSDWTDEAIGRTNEAPPPPPSPTAPGGLAATGGEDFVTWTWRAVADVDGYQIQYSENEAFTSTDPMEDLSAETLSYTKENLEGGTSHYLRIRSFIEVDGTRYKSDWSPHATGMTDPPRPAVPTGLTVDADTTDDDSIGWEWDGVAGVNGYQVQFGLTETFPDDDHDFQTNNTSYVVHRLDAETDGYLRVRSVRGTGASARASLWSDASRGRTTAASEPESLAAPANFRSTATGVTSVTLAWDAVSGADTYEVQQRADNGRWVDASCGGANEDNEVDGTTCVASGLGRGATYDFRVRAVPDSSDDEVASDWTTVTGVSTEGAAPPTDITGAGDLNITWRSNLTSITWRWQPSASRDYQTKVLTEVLDPANPCEDRNQPWSSMAGFSSSLEDETNLAALLCVRGTYTDTSGKTQYDDPSWSWAGRAPDVPGSGASQDDTDDHRTSTLSWTVVFADNDNLDYEFRYVRDRLADNDDPDNDLEMSQATCEAGSTAEILSPVGDGGTYTTTTSVTLGAYSAYGLCYRALNENGRSDWSFTPENAVVSTLPNAVSVTRQSYANNPDGTETTIVWRLNTGGSIDAPTETTGYDAQTITHPATRLDSNDRRVTVVAPNVESCELNTGGTQGDDMLWNIETATVTDDPDVDDRLVIDHDADRPTNGDPDDRVYVCVRPKLDNSRVGSWTLSRAETVADQTSS